MNLMERINAKATERVEALVQRGEGYTARERGIELDWNNLQQYSTEYLYGYWQAGLELGSRKP